MKVYSIGFSPNRRGLENKQKPCQAVLAKTIAPKSPKTSVPYYAMLANSAITFGRLSNLLPKVKGKKELAEILPCAYCNRPMILSEKIFSIKWPSDKEPTEIYNKKLIAIIEPYRTRIHEGELAVFDTIKYLNSKYPDSTFQELLFTIRAKNLEGLITKENEILNKLKLMAKELNDISMTEEVINLIKESQSILKHDKLNHPFKRKLFIDNLETILKVKPEDENQKITLKLSPEDEKKEAMVDMAYLLPSSKDNKNAFIIKYSSPVQKPDGTWVYRTSQEIAHNILSGARSTCDHIVSSHPQTNLEQKGETNADNLILACDSCNSFFKMNLAPRRFIKRYPEAPKNIQKQINVLVKKTNSGVIIEGAKYIEGLAGKFEKLSVDGIDLRIDTSKLNPQTSKSQSLNKNPIKA